MKGFLTHEARASLLARHRRERDRRSADRIKAVLLSDQGWSFRHISEALLLDEATISQHVRDYQEREKLLPENGGSLGKLSLEQADALEAHLETVTYLKVSAICAYVEETYGVTYTVSGMTDWLKGHHFSYKRPKGTPAKADPVQQEAFIQAYEAIEKEACEKGEPVLFLDGVHPTMATKVTGGWIRKGVNKPIQTTASRTRLNLLGTLNLATMGLKVLPFETLNGEALSLYFAQIRKDHPDGKRIHLILDQGPYNTCQVAKEAARQHNIVLHYLPPYSPNLNPIERVWKIMNEHVRNNVFFKTAKDFKESILAFFNKTWPQIAQSMVDRVNDNFQRLNPIPSS